MPFASRSSRSSTPAFGLLHGPRGIAAIALAVGLLLAGGAARAADTYWLPGTSASQWSTAGNWSNGVPGSTTNALTGTAGMDAILGAGAQAKTLYIQGPIGGQSTLSSGTLTLSDQLWINITSGSTEATTVPLRLYDAGSAPVSVTANNVTLAADPGSQGGILLDSQPGGSVSLAATDSITIGYDGDGSFVRNAPVFGNAHGTSSITADTIKVSVTASAGNIDYNRIETTNAGQTVTAANLQLGIAGRNAVATAEAGSWSIGTTVLGVESTAAGNQLTVSHGGTFTNSGAFTVGVNGSNNFVNVGFNGVGGSAGALRMTGPNDLVIGSGTAGQNNSFNVNRAGSTLSVNGNVVVGVDGSNNEFRVTADASASSGGARLGVNAGSSGNIASGSGASWTMNGFVRVGDKGSDNQLIVDGGTVTLTGVGKNLYVGYDKSASWNGVGAVNGGTLSVKAAGADLVVSGNVTGTGANSTNNYVVAYLGGVIDANRTLVGDGGQIWGYFGTIKGGYHRGRRRGDHARSFARYEPHLHRQRRPVERRHVRRDDRRPEEFHRRRRHAHARRLLRARAHRHHRSRHGLHHRPLRHALRRLLVDHGPAGGSHGGLQLSRPQRDRDHQGCGRARDRDGLGRRRRRPPRLLPRPPRAPRPEAAPTGRLNRVTRDGLTLFGCLTVPGQTG